MSSPRHWTGLGCGLGALTVLVLLVLGPGVVSGPLLTFSSVLLASVALLVAGLLLRRVGVPSTQAAGGVLVGIGVAWLAFVAGLVALMAATATNWGP